MKFYAVCPKCSKKIEFEHVPYMKLKTSNQDRCPNCKQSLYVRSNYIFDFIIIFIAIMLIMKFKENALLIIALAIGIEIVIGFIRPVKQFLFNIGFYKLKARE